MSTPSNAMNFASYRRLARAYPAGRRRDELLDTMIMAAMDEARPRPSGREVVDVLRHAPRAWLGRPGSRGVVLAAAAVALLSALLTGTLAAGATAAARYEPPTAAELAEVGAVVAPGVAFTTAGRYDRPLAIVDGQPGYGYTWLAAEPDAVAREFRPYTEGIVARLRQAGWQADWRTEAPSYASTRSHRVVASKAGLALEISTSRTAGGRVLPDGRIAGGPGQLVAVESGAVPSPSSPGGLDISVFRVESDGVLVAAVIGAVVGVVLGWLLAGWASRRTEHHLWASSALAVLTAVAVLTVAPSAWYRVQTYSSMRSDGWVYFDSPLWGWLFDGGPRFLTTPAALAMISAAVVTVLARRRAGRMKIAHAAAIRRPPQVITAVVLAAAVVCLAGVYLVRYGLPLEGPGSVLTAGGVVAVVLFRIVTHLRRPATAAPPDIGP